jgi:hypothetical protein
MKIKMIAALSIVTAASLPLAAVANACGGGGDVPTNYEFITPSGNIVCDFYADNMGASCEIREHTWVVPAATRGPEGRACDFSFGGLSFSVSQAKPARLGCYEGVSSFFGNDQQTLDYGQTMTRGAMTCTSEVSGVTCTATGTGHYFHVSREEYELG